MKENPRYIALGVLEKVEKSKAYSNISLNQSIQKSNLSDRDIALLTEIVYGTIQRIRTIDYYLKQFIKKDLKKLDAWVLSLLRLSLYQMVYLDKVPDHAVINEAVNIAKKRGHKGISGFVNGVLRSIQRKNEWTIKGMDDRIVYLGTKYSVPDWLISRWIEQIGEEETIKMCEANLERPVLTLRVNTYKTTIDSVIQDLIDEGVDGEKSSFIPNAIVVNAGNAIKTTPFEMGLITVQDESSMLVPIALDVQKGMRVLDACAAPGGKTTHIAELMENQGEVVALDLHEHKVRLIEQNAKRLNLTNIHSKALDSRLVKEHFEENSFDRILLDAPCSGFGVLRRKPEIKWSKKVEDITNISKIQLDLLQTVSQMLKIGGILIYSTCTIDKKENQDVIESFLQMNGNFVFDEELMNRLPDQVGPYEHSGQVQLLPHYFHTDGFYIAALKKIG